MAKGDFTSTAKQYKKTCQSCAASFMANAPRSAYCDTCRPLVKQANHLQAQKRYEAGSKYDSVRHKYNTTTRKDRRTSTPVDDQRVAAAAGARFSR